MGLLVSIDLFSLLKSKGEGEQGCKSYWLRYYRTLW